MRWIALQLKAKIRHGEEVSVRLDSLMTGIYKEGYYSCFINDRKESP